MNLENAKVAISDGVDEDLLAFHCQLMYLKSRSGHTGLTMFSWRLSINIEDNVILTAQSNSERRRPHSVGVSSITRVAKWGFASFVARNISIVAHRVLKL